MKFKFKTQSFQNDAVASVVNVFEGQTYSDSESYKTSFVGNIFDSGLGFSNPKISLTNLQLLSNIKKIQEENSVELSDSLSNKLGAVDLDIEMETGTGKTYVYIKTIFELDKNYGFKKYIVVVPSIPIREGVKKTFEMTADHFMELYGKKARFFIYNSKNLDEIEHFSSSDSINVMIINIQAFNARGADARKIYEELDAFQSRRPIDVIAQNRPILIMDEPQKMGGAATQDSLKNFNPLFSINYSATHKTKHNLLYVLDALDAFNKRLVKKIEVKGFSVKNLRGTSGYIYLQDIILSPKKPPQAKIEFDINFAATSINRETRLLTESSDLFERSNHLEEYKNGYIINEINPIDNSITFVNGLTLTIGEAVGDVSDDDLRRIQIRETIRTHLRKEEELFFLNIKVLSLFFIDEVAKYRQYDANGNEINGLYGDIFEEEYDLAIKEFIENKENEYTKYLKTIKTSETHKGYFSIDKKGRKVDSEIKRGSDISDDESAYDLILKDKERLLSFEEPTRFIFSHSALREGWDNPNVFQICTLKHSSSNVQRHQEVGRGLRLCVNKYGDRIDSTMVDYDVHNINKLTVIANDSYDTFVRGLQNEITENLYDRPQKATPDYFVNKRIAYGDKTIKITESQANSIYKYLIQNDYLDDDDQPNEKYKNDAINDSLQPFKQDLVDYTKQIHRLIKSLYDKDALKEMFENGNSTKIVENKLNDNFKKKEFQELWSILNHKYTYLVSFSSEELIKKSVDKIAKDLNVSSLLYTVSTGEQKSHIASDDIKNKESFTEATTRTSEIHLHSGSHIKYDLIGKIAEQTALTRKTIFAILNNIPDSKFDLFKDNSEEFIAKVSRIINEQKASMLVEHLEYNQIEGEFDVSIFVEVKKEVDLNKAFKATRHIKDYVVVDGTAEKSVERKFVENLDKNEDVVVYAKLPTKFYIPTPVGKYSPDWAIAFKEGNVKHVYFIAETKGSLSSLQLRPEEAIKIECAKKLFNKLSDSRVKYGHIDNYDELLKIIYGKE